MESNPEETEEIRRQNEDVLKTLKPGDLIKFNRDYYEDWAVYIGHEEGVHKVIYWWTGQGTYFQTRLARAAESFLQFFSFRKDVEKGRACIRIGQFWEVAGISKAKNGNEEDREDEKSGIIDGNKVSEGAKAFKDRTETEEITGLFDSSEHFAKWCRYGFLAQIKSVEEIAKQEDLSALVRDPMPNNNRDVVKTMEHNKRLLDALKEGDLIKFSRTYYYHWAVYIGKHDEIEHAVIHWWSPADSRIPKKGVSITITCFWKVANGDMAYKGNDNDCENRNIDGLQVVRRALIRYSLVTEEGIIKDNYNIVFNNCKQFAKWCRYGSDTPDKTQESSNHRVEVNLNIEDTTTRAAVLEIQKNLYKSVMRGHLAFKRVEVRETKNLVLEEKIKQLISEIKKLHQDNFQRDFFMCVVGVLCVSSFLRGRK